MEYSSNFIWCYLQCLYLLVNLYLLPSASAIEALSVPQATTITTGQGVVFNCTADEPAGEKNIIEWYIHWDSYQLLKANAQKTTMLTDEVYGASAGRGIYRTEYYNTNKPDNSTIHVCLLEITDATLLDTGYFGCTHRVDPDNNYRTLMEEKVKLTVVQLPNNGFPRCEQGDETTDFISLTCTSLGGVPAALLTWYNDKSEVLSPEQNNSVVYYKPKDEMVRQYTCVAMHPGFAQPKACAIMFDVSTTTVLPSTTPKVTTPKVTGETGTISSTELNVTDITTDSDNITLTKYPLPPVLKSTKPNYLIPIIIGASSVALLIFLLFIILLSLLCRRKKKRRKHPLIFIQDSSAPGSEEQELPTLDTSPQAVSENPYAELGQVPVVSKEEPANHDYDDAVLKPWKYNPELLETMTAENGGFVGDNDVNNMDNSIVEEENGASGYTPPESIEYTPPPSEGGELKPQEYGLGNIYATRL